MNTSKQTKPKVKLLTKTSPKKLGRPRKSPLPVEKVVNASRFMAKAKEATKKTETKTPKMLFTSPTSLKNIKWLKKDETLNFLPGVQRKMILAHSNVLTNSIQLYGFIRPVIVVEVDFIDGYMRKYIVDAQHGLMSCMRLGICFAQTAFG